MSSIWDDEEFRIWSGVEFEAHVMEEFERGFNSLCDSVRVGQYPQRENIETLKHNQYNKLFDIAIRLNQHPNNRENITARSDLHDLVDRLWQGYEQQLHDAYSRRDTFIEQRIDAMVENKNQQFTKEIELHYYNSTKHYYHKALSKKRILKEMLTKYLLVHSH